MDRIAGRNLMSHDTENKQQKARIHFRETNQHCSQSECHFGKSFHKAAPMEIVELFQQNQCMVTE